MLIAVYEIITIFPEATTYLSRSWRSRYAGLVLLLR